MSKRCEICEESSELYACLKCVRFSERSCRESAAEAERAAIVNWLTSKTVAYGEQPRLDFLIDDIERGEHLK